MRLPAPKGCRSCGAPVRWVLTHKGNRMPVDADPRHDGNLVIETAETPDGIHARPHDPLLDDPGITRWGPHFATCPNAEEHRRAKTK